MLVARSFISLPFVRDSWTLFKLLDEEGNGDINLSDA